MGEMQMGYRGNAWGGGWLEAEIDISTKTGPLKTPAFVNAKAPGLAVTMHVFGEFCVTQIASGLRLCGPYERAGNAALAMAEWAACADCTKDGPGIMAQMDDTPVPFAGATSGVGENARPMTKRDWMICVRSDMAGDEFPWEDNETDPWGQAERVLAALDAAPSSVLRSTAGARGEPEPGGSTEPATAVRERPILFSGPMVRAILDGRKTVTRRVVKRLGGNPWFDEDDGVWRDHWEVWAHGASEGPTYDETPELRCPYGAPGDRLWVRETFAAIHVSVDPETGYGDDVCGSTEIPKQADPWWSIVYAAADPDGDAHPDDRGFRWRPSIHMPRWASRLLLEVVSVRVERLAEITEEDAAAEGVEPVPCEPASLAFGTYKARFRYRDSYRELWDSLNAARGFGWDANPFVWRVEFRRCP